MSETSDLNGIKILTQNEFINNVNSTENDTLYFVEMNNYLFDGQPISKYALVTESTAVGTGSYNLSSYLPSDNYSYAVYVYLRIASGNTTYLYVGNTSSPYDYRNFSSYFCMGGYSTSSGSQVHTNFCIPLPGASRTLYWQLAGSKASSSAGIYLKGYRRLGTNS